MRKTLVLIRNITAQSQVPDQVSEWVEMVWEALEKVFVAVAKGGVI